MKVNYLTSSKYINLFIALLLLCVVTYTHRMLMADNICFIDEEITINYWCWKFNDWRYFLDFFPTGKDTDRPVGWMLINILYNVFGVNYRIQFFCVLLLHYINSIMVFNVGGYIFNKKYISMIVAILFALHYPGSSASYYIGSIFDVLCCTFMLLSIIFYMRIDSKIFCASIIFSLLFFYLSLRSKEMSLLLPVILILFDLIVRGNWCSIPNIWHSFAAIFNKNISFVMLSLVTVCIFIASGRIGRQLKVSDVYYTDFSIKTFIDVFNHYFSVLLMIDDNYYSVILFVSLLAVGILAGHKVLIWSLFSYLFIILPVLFYPNHIFDIYLYMPSVFLAIAFGCMVEIVFKMIGSVKIKYYSITIIFIMLLLIFGSEKINDKIRSDNKISTRKSIGKLINFLVKEISHVENDTNIYIDNMPYVQNVTGGEWHQLRNIIRLVYRNDTINIFTDNIYKNLSINYINDKGNKIFIEYYNKSFVVSRRDTSYK